MRLLPLSTPTRLLSLECPRLLRHLTFRLESTIVRLKTLADTSHLWLHDARNVVVAVLGDLDEDVVEVGEELGYSCHRCLCEVCMSVETPIAGTLKLRLGLFCARGDCVNFLCV